jgi:hypothetical protein
MFGQCQLSCSFLALAATCHLHLTVDSQLGCTQSAQAQSVSSTAHIQLLCDVSIQPYSVYSIPATVIFLAQICTGTKVVYCCHVSDAYPQLSRELSVWVDW